jgi:hypothetical protein
MKEVQRKLEILSGRGGGGHSKPLTSRKENAEINQPHPLV